MLASNYSGFSLEAGTDEAGRGCLSGPVVAAAVILPKNFTHPFLNDSKQLSEKKREELRPFIEENALAFGVSFVWQDEVDAINVLQASITGMHRSIEMLKIKPEYIIVDGNKFRDYRDIPSQTIVKGDAKYLSIAAASILAKTYRDEYMAKIHTEFRATKYHRKTFKLLPEQLTLEL